MADDRPDPGRHPSAIIPRSSAIGHRSSAINPPNAVECIMIRPTEPRDTAPLIEIARGTGVFRDLELTALREVLDDYHEVNREAGHLSVSYEHGGRLAGLAYYAPASMTDRTWYLYWIIVDKPLHSRGIGGRLLRHAEGEIRGRGGRLFLIETSSLPLYEPTRRFYLRHGYDATCTIPDYYTDGDSLVVFSKRLLPRGDEPGP
jgi:GNAT superfamily N-acetyltransferase